MMMRGTDVSGRTVAVLAGQVAAVTVAMLLLLLYLMANTPLLLSPATVHETSARILRQTPLPEFGRCRLTLESPPFSAHTNSARALAADSTHTKSAVAALDAESAVAALDAESAVAALVGVRSASSSLRGAEGSVAGSVTHGPATHGPATRGPATQGPVTRGPATHGQVTLDVDSACDEARRETAVCFVVTSDADVTRRSIRVGCARAVFQASLINAFGVFTLVLVSWLAAVAAWLCFTALSVVSAYGMQQGREDASGGSYKDGVRKDVEWN
jgi:hypothetical protein